MATLVIDETVFIVSRVELVDGSITIQGIAPGPMGKRKSDQYDVSLHGDDGVLVASGRVKFGHPRIYRGDTVTVDWPLRAVDKRV